MFLLITWSTTPLLYSNSLTNRKTNAIFVSHDDDDGGDGDDGVLTTDKLQLKFDAFNNISNRKCGLEYLFR